MEWHRRFLLEPDNPFRGETPYGTLSVTLEDGTVEYRRPARPQQGEEEPVRRTLLTEALTESATLDFLPLYPDRPIVFKPQRLLSVPPGQNGFFCFTLPLAVGVTLRKTDTLLEELLPAPRKDTYWGAPDQGVLSYQVRSPVHTEPGPVMVETDRVTAVVPVYYRNHREESDGVERCLVPLRELDLYRTEEGDLIFEVVTLEHLEDFYQRPSPIKRAPRELQEDVTRFLTGPDKPRSLLGTLEDLPHLDRFTSLFMNR